MINVLEYNRRTWNALVEQGNPWTIPADEETIRKAKQGSWQILLTPCKPVPITWFPPIKGCQVLCLASGGGQQGPILAAAGARVMVLDNSPKQLAQDRFVARREALSIDTIMGDMANLSMFPDKSFDLVINPVSNVFTPDVHPVWRGAYRILRPGGSLLTGFNNPIRYLFDNKAYEKGIFKVKHKLPYSDLTSLSERERLALIEAGYPLEFGHTLEEQIGGQIDAGFFITGFYEDIYQPEEEDSLSKYMSIFIATRAIKPKQSRGKI